jgi:hypothetical protein
VQAVWPVRSNPGRTATGSESAATSPSGSASTGDPACPPAPGTAAGRRTR